jgi:hypothetical protein
VVALSFGTWVVWRLLVVPHGGSQKLEVADLFAIVACSAAVSRRRARR